jgi:hypothetical protein
MAMWILLSFGYKALCVNKPATHRSGQRSRNSNAHVPFEVQNIGKTAQRETTTWLKGKGPGRGNSEGKIVNKICIIFTKVNFLCLSTVPRRPREKQRQNWRIFNFDIIWV